MLLTALLTLNPASASGLSAPSALSNEQRAILAAARAGLKAALAMPVRLQVYTLRDDGRWAFLTAIPLDAHGKRIDYASTPYADAVKQGMFEDWVCALLYKEPGGGWTTTELVIGATDAPFVDWPRRYGVPRALIVPGDNGVE